jgi:hypothetical protein
MRFTKKSHWLLFAAVSLFFFSLGHAAVEKEKSPLLGDTSKFKPSKERPTLLVDRPGTKRAIDYKKIMFDPVLIYQSPHSTYRPLTPEDKATLSKLFQKAAVDSFKDVVQIVDVSGEGVLRVQFAIRGLKRGNYHMTAKGSEPIKQDSKMPSGTLEVLATDSVSKERVLALVDVIDNKKLANSEREEIVPTVEEVFHDWVDMLKNTFQREQVVSQIPK